jgi:hypothetical protein
MLDTLQKMSGVTHKTYRDSKTITRDMQKLMMQNEGKASYTVTTKEVPVISYNDMAFINERNSMLFRAGDAPVWNRNECILPMSWRLFSNTIKQPGKDYTLQTIPTLSSSVEFDLKGNQPDFEKMLDKRMEQAIYVPIATKLFQDSYGYTDADIARLDIDAYSKEIMEMVNDMIWQDVQKKAQRDAIKNGDITDITNAVAEVSIDDADFGNVTDTEDNTEMNDVIKAQQEADEIRKKKIYAGGSISKADLVNRVVGHNKPEPRRGFNVEFINAFIEIRGGMYSDSRYFRDIGGDLYAADGRTAYIKHASSKAREQAAELEALNEAAQHPDRKVFADGKIDESDLPVMDSWEITDDFYFFLEALDKWDFAGGRFEEEMIRRMT